VSVLSDLCGESGWMMKFGLVFCKEERDKETEKGRGVKVLILTCRGEGITTRLWRFWRGSQGAEVLLLPQLVQLHQVTLAIYINKIQGNSFTSLNNDVRAVIRSGTS
jgi:hypothetical protein